MNCLVAHTAKRSSHTVICQRKVSCCWELAHDHFYFLMYTNLCTMQQQHNTNSRMKIIIALMSCTLRIVYFTAAAACRMRVSTINLCRHASTRMRYASRMIDAPGEHKHTFKYMACGYNVQIIRI